MKTDYRRRSTFRFRKSKNKEASHLTRAEEASDNSGGNPIVRGKLSGNIEGVFGLHNSQRGSRGREWFPTVVRVNRGGGGIERRRFRSDGDCGSTASSRSEPMVRRRTGTGRGESEKSGGCVESKQRRHCR